MPSAQTIHIPAGLPIDESTRVEILDAGKANRANVNVRQTDRFALTKRLGFAGMTKARLGESDRSNGLKLFQHKGVPMVIHRPDEAGPLYVDSYSETLDSNVQLSEAPECSYRMIDLPVPGRAFTATDTAYANGFIVTATVSPAVVIVSDAATNVPILTWETGVAASGATLASFSERYVALFVRDSSTTAITLYILDTEDIASGFSGPTTVAATSSVAIPCSASLEDRAAIAYGTSSGTDRVTVKTYDESSLLEVRTIDTDSGTPSHIDIDGSIAGTLWVVWDVSGDPMVIGLDADDVATTLATAVAPLSSDNTHVLFVCEGPSNTARVLRTQYGNLVPSVASTEVAEISTTAGAAVVSDTSIVWNVGLMSKPWRTGERFFMAVCGGARSPAFSPNIYRANQQRTCIVIEFTDNDTWWTPHANIEPGLVSLASTSKVVAIDANKYVFPVQLVKSGGSTFQSILSGDSTAANMLCELDFGSLQRWQATSFANYTYLGGALTSVFDGQRIVEAGFLMKPSQPSATEAGGSGSFSGTYRYVAIYEDVDAAGNWTVSGISDPSESVTATSDTGIEVEVTPIAISRRNLDGTVRAALYRTTDGGEPPYYRLGTIDNDTTTDTLTYEDNTTDDTLTTHAKLYAPNLPGTVPDGGTNESLDRRAPPGLIHITSYNGMLVGARGESFFHSGQEVYGEAPWFNPVFEVPITGGGDITALAAQDGTLFVFKVGRIYAVTGEPPSDNGLIGGFGVPRLLASDVGCTDARSVVVTSLGIFFRSARGIELLNRSQQVEFVGDPIITTVDANPVTTAAVLDERNSLVRFSLAEGESGGVVTGDGVDIVYDLAIRAWISTDIKHGSSTSQAAQSSTLIKSGGEWKYAWLGTDGTVYVERDDDDVVAHLDVNAWVTAQYEISPLKMGLQQEQRIYEMELLFERHTACGLTIEVANDYGEYAEVTDDEVWIDTDVELAGRQVSFRPKPRGMAVQLRIRDTEPTTVVEGQIPILSGKGLTFIGLSADIAAEQRATRGTPRLAAGVRR